MADSHNAVDKKSACDRWLFSEPPSGEDPVNWYIYIHTYIHKSAYTHIILRVRDPDVLLWLPGSRSRFLESCTASPRGLRVGVIMRVFWD